MSEKHRLTTEAFKALRLAGQLPASAVLVKRGPAQLTKADDGDSEGRRILRATISTDAVDRHGDVIRQDGWELDTFRKGGVILWNHDSFMPPIGKPLGAEVDGNALKSSAEFATREQSEFADTVYQLALGGYVRSVSVGFVPIEAEQRELAEGEDRDRYCNPLMFNRQELLEWSPVSIPANPEALIDAKGHGINVAPIASYVKRYLDGEGIGALWLSRAIAERAYQAARDDGHPVHSIPAATASEARQPEEERSAISYGDAHSRGTPTASDPDKAWNAATERKKASIDDLKVMAAWVDDSRDEAKASYRLLHHYCDITYSLSWKGLQASMSALLTGRAKIPEADRQRCYDHLASHYRAYKAEPPIFDAGCDEDEEKSAGEQLEMALQTHGSDDHVTANVARIRELKQAIVTHTKDLQEDLVGALFAAVNIIEAIHETGGEMGDEAKTLIGKLHMMAAGEMPEEEPEEEPMEDDAKCCPGEPDTAAPVETLTAADLLEVRALVSAAVRAAILRSAGHMGD